MCKAQYIVYDSLDELRRLCPDVAAYIEIDFKNYHGRIYKFPDLDELGIYEITKGSYANVINFDSPGVRPINLESTIDFYVLGCNILKAGLINVICYNGWIYVLPDLK